MSAEHKDIRTLIAHSAPLAEDRTDIHGRSVRNASPVEILRVLEAAPNALPMGGIVFVDGTGVCDIRNNTDELPPRGFGFEQSRRRRSFHRRQSYVNHPPRGRY